DHDGIHSTEARTATVRLSAGAHAIAVAYFEREGQEALKLSFGRAGAEPREVPASALTHRARALRPPPGASDFDPARIEAGARLFRERGCAACHGGGEPGARPLAALDAGAPGGCLDSTPRPGLPDFRLDDARRAALRAAIALGP